MTKFFQLVASCLQSEKIQSVEIEMANDMCKLLQKWRNTWHYIQCDAMQCNAMQAISFPEPRFPWPAVEKRELCEQPFWNKKGNNRILPIRFHAVYIYSPCLKWLLPELSIPAAGQKDRGLWGRECNARDCHPYNERMLKDSPVSIHFTSWKNAETLLPLVNLSLWFQWRKRSQTTLMSTKTTDNGHRELASHSKLEHWISYEKKAGKQRKQDWYCSNGQGEDTATHRRKGLRYRL